MASSDPFSPDMEQLIAIAQGKVKVSETDIEHRRTRRCPLHGQVAFVQTTHTGGTSIATSIDCHDIGPGGMGVRCRHMLHVGYEGAVLILRAHREPVILGVKVSHCRYSGSMEHEAGLVFTQAPANFTIDDFRDEQGNLPGLAECLMAA